MASLLLCRRLSLSSASVISQCLPLCLSPSLIRFNPPPNSRFFSASSKAEMEEAERVSANKRLKYVLQKKISSWPGTFSLPKDYPFEIVPYRGPDEDGYDAHSHDVLLKRKFHDEDIEVKVDVQNLDFVYEDEEEEKDDDNKDGEDEDEDPSSELCVKIEKAEGRVLEFSCSSYPKNFTVNKMSLLSYKIVEEDTDAGKKEYKFYNYHSEYTGPRDLDAETLEAAKKCLEARGIDESLVKFAEQYVLSKNLKQLDWLKKFEKFATF